jgi:hypothetical protein
MSAASSNNVSYWPNADMSECTAHVCFQPGSGQYTARRSWIARLGFRFNQVTFGRPPGRGRHSGP